MKNVGRKERRMKNAKNISLYETRFLSKIVILHAMQVS